MDEAERWNDLWRKNAEQAGPGAQMVFPEAPDARQLADFVAHQPGPAPWALAKRSLHLGAETWHWSHEEGSAATILRDADGQARLVVGFDVFATPVSAGRLLLHTTVGDNTPKGLALVVVDLRKTSALDAAALTAPSRTSPWTVAREARLASILVPAALTPGEHRFDFPADFHSLGRSTSAVGDRIVHGKQRRYHYALRWSENRVKIVDLHWFNDGTWDFGHQWISRVVSTPGGKGSHIAEVVRGGLAELHPDGKTVLRWIVAHPFWMPMPPPADATAK